MSQNGDSRPTIEITCPECQRKFTALLPVTELTNNLRSSVLVSAHDKLIRCTNGQCRKPFALMITNFQLMWAAAVVGDDAVEQMEGSRIVKPDLLVH